MSVMAQGYTMLAMRKLLLTYALIIGIALTVACEGATPENIPSALATLAPTVDIDAPKQIARDAHTATTTAATTAPTCSLNRIMRRVA